MTSVISVKVTTRDGEEKTVTQGAGHTTLMQMLYEEDIGVEAVCGGCASCATCHVLIDPNWMGKLPERDQAELMLLQYAEFYDPERSRLSCQLALTPRYGRDAHGHRARGIVADDSPHETPFCPVGSNSSDRSSGAQQSQVNRYPRTCRAGGLHGYRGAHGPEIGYTDAGDPWFRVGDYRLDGVRYEGSPFMESAVRLANMDVPTLIFRCYRPTH